MTGMSVPQNTNSAELVSYELIQITEEVRITAKRTLLNVIDLGRLFTLAKEACRREKVSFIDWYSSEEVGFSSKSVSNYMRLYEMSKNVSFAHLDISPSAAFVMIESTSPERAVDELFIRAERGERITYSKAVEVIDRAKYIEETPDETNQNYTMSESHEWYTPSEYVEAARNLMGGIDLDPASNEFANRVVKATQYYDSAQNGLDLPWFGRVFVNPPYGRDEDRNSSHQSLWSARICDSWEAGEIDAGILLVSTSVDSRWFVPLWHHLICFTDHRIRFYREGPEIAQPVTGSAFVYFGRDDAGFIRHFSTFGPIVQRIG